MNLPQYGNPFYQWALTVVRNANQLKEKQVTETTTLQTADVQAYEKDLIDRAVRWARETERCEEFTEAMGELFPGVLAVDSDGIDCEGRRVNLNGGVDAAKVKAETIASIVDKAVRLARQYPNVVSAANARVAFNAVFPGVAHLDSDGRGL